MIDGGTVEGSRRQHSVMSVPCVTNRRETEMATNGGGQNLLSRRALLASGMLAMPVTAALITLRPELGAAQQKVAQKLVQYQLKPKNNQKCSLCLHFVPPDSCKVVDGKINPDGWCALFAPKPK
jgi:hypothetical protein